MPEHPLEPDLLRKRLVAGVSIHLRCATMSFTFWEALLTTGAP
jgi:hypothetical protein